MFILGKTSIKVNVFLVLDERRDLISYTKDKRIRKEISPRTKASSAKAVVYWPSTRPNMPFQRRRKWHIPMASYGKKSRRQAWLTIWDKVKSHGTVTNWCTGREWPVNCMTVISAQWRSTMPFQRRRKWHIPMASYGEILSGRLNYYITR